MEYKIHSRRKKKRSGEIIAEGLSFIKPGGFENRRRYRKRQLRSIKEQGIPDHWFSTIFSDFLNKSLEQKRRWAIRSAVNKI